jgi:ceramide glucosyltransferase
VVQAVLGGDPGLAAALEDNVRELPGARFLWLADVDDPAGLQACEAARARCPGARVDVLRMEPSPEGVNPKLHKLEAARRGIGEPVLLVLDDDTRIPAATLAGLLAALEGHDLATALPGYRHDGRLGGRLLAQFVNNNAALTYLPLLGLVDPPTINGAVAAPPHRRPRTGAADPRGRGPHPPGRPARVG